jgi:glycine oxidase
VSDYKTSDVVIIGAGVIGCSIAYYLSKAGVHVAVVERDQIAAEASSAAAGLIAPLGYSSVPGPYLDLRMASWSLYPELIPTLEEISGIQIEDNRLSALNMSTYTDDLDGLRQKYTFWQQLGLQVSWLTAAELRTREPLLSERVQGAIYSAEEISMKPPLMTKAFAEAARIQGTQFIEHSEVIAIQHSGSRATGVQTITGQTIACQQVVIACGAWSARFSDWLGCALPVSPMRGQILALHQPATPLKHIVFDEHIYLAPKLDHTIYVGATIEQAGFEKNITAEGISSLLNSAIRAVPALSGASIARMWSGLRPWSPDSYPILGKAPNWENVQLATGHSANGFLLSAITGKSMAEAITTGQIPAVIQPFGIERFQ